MIDVSDNFKRKGIHLCEYPAQYKYFGKETTDDDLQIFVKNETLNEIDDYLSSDTNNELGGVLVGDVCINGNDVNFILIENLIIAKHTNSSISRLTFTHDTWSYINEVLEKDYPEKKILGWFHSHPGHTVFLSNFDTFIHENFFNMNYMVAYVFDPTIKDRGFFFWKDNKIVKSTGFHIYDIKKKSEQGDFNEYDSLINTRNNPKTKSTDKTMLNSSFRSNFILIILLLNLLLLILMIYNYFDLKNKIFLKEDYLKESNELKEDTKKINERLDNLIIDMELKNNALKSNDSLLSK